MIKIHKWLCETCDTNLFLCVNDELEKDRKRLGDFMTYVSLHCFDKGHIVVHKEKKDFVLKRV